MKLPESFYEVAKDYGVSKEELFAVARENSLVQEPIKISPMGSVIANMIKERFYNAR